MSSKRKKGNVAISKIFFSSFSSRAVMALLAICAGLIMFAGFRFENLISTKNWRKAEGKILSSKLIEEWEEDSSGVTISYNPVINYSYTIGDKVFRGDQISYKVNYGSTVRKNSFLIERYPKGREVTVYYNPEKLDESCLEKSLKLAEFISLGLGLLLLFAFFKGKMYENL